MLPIRSIVKPKIIEFERIKLVFKAMTLSLLTGLESENEAED